MRLDELGVAARATGGVSRRSTRVIVRDMTVEAIKDAIEEEAWDRQMERDFALGGRAAFLLDEAKADIAAGRTKPMEEFLAEAKADLDQSKTSR